MHLQDGFNVRVYGLLEVDGRILISEENHKGASLVKFPGGGIEKGESPQEALKREFIEEANCRVELGEFFYASPNFHKSYFRPMQLIGLYWRVRLAAGEEAPKGHVVPQPLPEPGHSYKLVWRALDQLKVNGFTAPLDQEVVEKLLREI